MLSDAQQVLAQSDSLFRLLASATSPFIHERVEVDVDALRALREQIGEDRLVELALGVTEAEHDSTQGHRQLKENAVMLLALGPTTEDTAEQVLGFLREAITQDDLRVGRASAWFCAMRSPQTAVAACEAELSREGTRSEFVQIADAIVRGLDPEDAARLAHRFEERVRDSPGYFPRGYLSLWTQAEGSPAQGEALGRALSGDTSMILALDWCRGSSARNDLLRIVNDPELGKGFKWHARFGMLSAATSPDDLVEVREAMGQDPEFAREFRTMVSQAANPSKAGGLVWLSRSGVLGEEALAHTRRTLHAWMERHDQGLLTPSEASRLKRSLSDFECLSVEVDAPLLPQFKDLILED